MLPAFAPRPFLLCLACHLICGTCRRLLDQCLRQVVEEFSQGHRISRVGTVALAVVWTHWSGSPDHSKCLPQSEHQWLASCWWTIVVLSLACPLWFLAADSSAAAVLSSSGIACSLASCQSDQPVHQASSLFAGPILLSCFERRCMVQLISPKLLLSRWTCIRMWHFNMPDFGSNK